jgi:histidinol dehydrogenase
MQVRAIDRVGMYVPTSPGAVYPSSVLMTAIPAKVAGVAELIMITPAGQDGVVAPLKLAAADIAGVDRVYAAGGAEGIAALAFGTVTVPRVDKIVGPGNIFVTLAKREVFGAVGIDALYGPSETIVIADETADPMLAAADLLAQAEHDELATPILVTVSMEVAEAVGREIERQLRLLEREQIARTAFEARGGAVVVGSVADAVELASEYAPEHLCLLVRDAAAVATKVRNAGGIFVGEDAPESLGDYTAGPSHVMPTSGAARYASPLGVHDFLKVTSVVAVDAATLRAAGPAAAQIARAEGFTAHARSIELRLDGGERDGAK